MRSSIKSGEEALSYSSLKIINDDELLNDLLRELIEQEGEIWHAIQSGDAELEEEKNRSETKIISLQQLKMKQERELARRRRSIYVNMKGILGDLFSSGYINMEMNSAGRITEIVARKTLPSNSAKQEDLVQKLLLYLNQFDLATAF